jgi:hypothetical protein
MWSTDYLGRPVRLLTAPDEPPPGQDPRELIEDYAMSLLRKADRPAPDTVPMCTLVDPGFASKRPMLWHYLTQSVWDDGSPRQTSSLLIFFQDGHLKGMLRDRDAGLCLWAAASGVTQLLDAFETLLVTPGIDWKVDRQQGTQQQAKRVKRG